MVLPDKNDCGVPLHSHRLSAFCIPRVEKQSSKDENTHKSLDNSPSRHQLGKLVHTYFSITFEHAITP